MSPLYWTVTEVAKILGVDRKTVRRRCRNGTLPYEINAAGHYVIRADVLRRILGPLAATAMKAA